MNKYLLQLLSEVNMLIIPGLGALNIVNKSTGEIMFMSYMKHDDGTLAKHIAEKEGWELNDAKNLISKFVREVQTQLDKGDSYDMFQFGSFKKVNGDVEFDQWKAGIDSKSTEEIPNETVVESILPSVAVLEIIEELVIETPVIETPVIETHIEEIQKEVIIEPESISEDNSVEEIATIEEVKIPEEVVVSEIVEAIEEPEIAIPPTINKSLDEILTESPKIENPVEEPESIVNTVIEEVPPVNIKAEETPIQPIEKEIKPLIQEVKTESKKNITKEKVKGKVEKPKTEKKGKNSIFAYVLWGIVILVLGAGTFVAVKFDSLKKDFPILAEWAGDKTASDSTAIPTNEDKEVNSNGESENVKEEPIEEVQVPEEQEEEITEVVEETPPPAPKVTPKPKVNSSANTTPKPRRTSSSSSSSPVADMDRSLPFHIIAGSFGSKANAQRLANKLAASGFSNASIEDKGGSYRVSAKGFSNKDAAISELASVQAIASGAWVYEVK